MKEDRTSPKTIWTQTLLDLLVTAVANRQEQDTVRMLREIKAKGVRKADVLAFAQARLNEGQVQRLEGAIRSLGRRRPAA
jgi:hypothetical protein